MSVNRVIWNQKTTPGHAGESTLFIDESSLMKLNPEIESIGIEIEFVQAYLYLSALSAQPLMLARDLAYI